MIKNISKINLGMVALVLVTMVLYVFKIDLSLIYQHQQPIFFGSFEDFIRALSYPEGLSIYLGDFLSEKLYYKYSGSVLIVLLQVLFITPFILVLKKQTAIRAWVINLIWIFSFLLFTSYHIRLESIIKLLIGLWLSFTWLLINFRVRNRTINILSLVIILIVNFWFGGGTSLLFSGLIILPIIVVSKQSINTKLVYGLLCVVLCLIIPIIAVYTNVQVVPLKGAFLGVFTSNTKYSIPVAYYLFTLILLALFIASFMIKRNLVWAPKFSTLISYVSSLIIIIAAIALVDGNVKLKLSNQRYAEQCNWSVYLDKVEEVESPGIIESFNTNRALFNLGLLLNKGNVIAQAHGEKGLFIEHQMRREHLMLSSDLYWELGYINESRHWAHEAFTSFGMQPVILKRLVDVNIVLGKFNTANKYIVLLKKSPLQKEWAEQREAYLYDIKKCEESTLYGSKIQGLPFQNFTSNRHSGLSGLVNLVTFSNENRMVIEYLTMNYLLRHDLAHIIELIPTYREYSYTELPEMVQQAILVYMAKTGKSPNLSGYSINENVRVEFNIYSQLYSSYRRGAEDSKAKIEEKFSGTFWYYMHFVSTLNKRNK